MSAIRMAIALQCRLTAEGLRLAAAARVAEVIVYDPALPDTFNAAADARADVILSDLALLGPGSVAACRRLRGLESAAKVVVLLAARDRDAVASLVLAGVGGIVMDDQELAGAVGAIDGVLHGELAIPRALVRSLVETVATSPVLERHKHHVTRQQLTEREREVLELIVRGSDTSSIAKALALSPNTARKHVENLMRKLGVHSRVELVAAAVASGFTPGWTAVPAALRTTS